MSIIDETSAPGVIDHAMIMGAMLQQGPQDEAGRIAKEEGQPIEEVEKLRLEFLNILRIDHLWPLTSLTSLCLSNNVIEKIENLHMLANLRELNLSFNRIETMENLAALAQLEILLLFENNISRIENIDSLLHLMIFSIGNNHVVDRNNVIYLRRFPVLHSLNMAGNPCAEAENFKEYIAAFLPNLKYYKYKMISLEERETAREHHRVAVDKIEAEEEQEKKHRKQQEARRKELEWHTAMFVEGLCTDELFHKMFEEDAEGNALLKLGEEAEQCYNEYRTQVMKTTQDLLKFGLEQHEVRQEEIRQFTECFDGAKKWSNNKSSRLKTTEADNPRPSEANQIFRYLGLAEEFLEKKVAIFAEIREVVEVLGAGDQSDESFPIERMQAQGDRFTSLSDTTWYSLVQTERILSEQLEEVMSQFERNLNDLVNSFIEQAQALFLELRSFARSFNEYLAEIAHRFLAARMADAGSIEIPPELQPFAESREGMTTALENSLETQTLVIDDRDDMLRERVQDWARDYIDSMQKKEIQRNRARMAEINHFIEVQTNEYDDLINTVSGTDDLFAELYG